MAGCNIALGFFFLYSMMGPQMNLREIMAENFKVFAKMNEASRQKNIETIQYIDILSNTTGIDISDWDLHDIFAKRGNTFASDRTEINQLFFGKHQELTAARPVEAGSIPEIVQGQINAIAARQAAARLQSLSSNRDAALRHARSKYREFEDYLTKAYTHTLDIESHNRGGGLDMAHQLMTLHGEGFWGAPILEGKFVYMPTTNSVVNIHRNPTAGLDLRADLGKFAVRIDLENINLIVIPYQNNLLSNGIYHPHISAHGHVCWGNGQDVATRSLSRGDILGALRLLASILMNYNDGNPYQPLQNFVTPGTHNTIIDPANPGTQPAVMREEQRRREQFAREQRT